LKIEDALNVIARNFKEEFLHVEKAMQVISDHLVMPLIVRMLPEEKKTAELLMHEHHREWNHGFRYPLFINEMIVERMLRIVNKIYKNS